MNIPQITAALGLHEDLTVTYDVDGYTAELMGGDGQYLLASSRGETIGDAILALEGLLGRIARGENNLG